MFDFHEKRRIRELLYSKPAIGLLFLLTIWLSISAYNRYEIAAETKKKLEMKQGELQSLQERSGVLEAQVHYLEDDRGIEEELRSRFDVAKEGEDVIVLVDERPHEEKTTTVEPSPSKKTSFFEQLKFW
jgi:cell division protein FtsB